MEQDHAGEDDPRLEAALRAQERVGWVISVLSVLLTAMFMVAITLDWSVLRRSLFGHAINGFTVATFVLLALFIAAVLLFSAIANRTDALRASHPRDDR